MIMTRLNPVKFLLTHFLPFLFPMYLSVIQLSTLQMNQVFPRNTKIQEFLNSVLETSLSGTLLSPASTQTTILQALNRKAILGIPLPSFWEFHLPQHEATWRTLSTEHTSLQQFATALNTMQTTYLLLLYPLESSSVLIYLWVKEPGLFSIHPSQPNFEDAWETVK